MVSAESTEQDTNAVEPPLEEVAKQAELELPPGLEPWAAALTLWASLNESTYRLVNRCYGDGRGPEWRSFISLLLDVAVVEPDGSGESFTFRQEWLTALEHALDSLGGADAARSRLIDAWLEMPDWALVARVAGWAYELARWDAVDRIWMALAEEPCTLEREVLVMYRDLPPEARLARPMLSWASGVAASLLSDSPAPKGEATLLRLLADSEVLHADWSVRADADAAVTAGTLRMFGERRLPTANPGQSIELAWRTKQEIDAFIDSHFRDGAGPGRTSQAIFRAFSARLALFRGDLQRAVTEARWAVLLSDWEPVTVLADGVEALAESLNSDFGPPRSPAVSLNGVVDDREAYGLKGIGRVFEVLAKGNDALRRLDRDGVDRALSAVMPEAAAVAGVWSVRVALAGFRAAVWGDVAVGLRRLTAEIANESLGEREQEEPLGRALLGRVRVALLIKSGAFGAATRTAEAMDGGLRLLLLARIALWAGQYEQAIRLAAAGPFEVGLDVGDQDRLQLLRAAAALLDGSCDEKLRVAGAGELRRILDNEAFIAIAMLPEPARDDILDLCRSHGLADHASFPALVDRLRLLNDGGGDGVRPVQLTERETLLLPMLAGKDSVPQIADRLHVSVNTVRKQVATLREKFHAETRAELVRKAIAYGAIH